MTRLRWRRQQRDKIKQVYGFIPNPILTVRQHAIQIFSEHSPSEISHLSRNLSFHNVCLNTTKVPHCVRSLLGLGLNFTITPTHKTLIKHIHMGKFEKDFYRRIQFAHQPFVIDKNDTNALFTPYVTWKPNTPKNEEFTSRLHSFEAKLNTMFPVNKPTKTKSTSLLPSQEKALTWLTEHPEIMVLNTDKNLGPAIIERHRYLDLTWRDHLSDKNTYRQLTLTDANRRITSIMNDISFFTTNFKRSLKNHEAKFITRKLLASSYDNSYS